MVISVVLSFRNEEEVIPELIKRLRQVLRKDYDGHYELIFVNDASTDASLNILLDERKKHNEIKVITMSRRFGIVPCIMAGIRYAQGDAVIYMDADLQDPPELIPQLIEKWKQGADVVYTTRTVRAGESKLKMRFTKLAYRLIRYVANINVPIDSGDFKLLSRRVVNELIRLDERDAYFKGLVTWVGFKQEQVLYNRDKRFAGNTHFSLLKSLGPFQSFIAGIASFSSLPLYLSLFIGMGILLSALVYAILVLIVVSTGGTVPGWSFVIMVLLFIGGIQLITLGIMGIYLARVHTESKKRPTYIIESMHGMSDEKHNPPAP